MINQASLASVQAINQSVEQLGLQSTQNVPGILLNAANQSLDSMQKALYKAEKAYK